MDDRLKLDIAVAIPANEVETSKVIPLGQGFYKLEGKHWSAIITQLKIYIGRGSDSEPVDLNFGESALVSRFGLPPAVPSPEVC